MKKLALDNTIRFYSEDIVVPEVIQFIAGRGGMPHTLTKEQLIKAVEDTNWCILTADELYKLKADYTRFTDPAVFKYTLAERVIEKFAFSSADMESSCGFIPGRVEE